MLRWRILFFLLVLLILPLSVVLIKRTTELRSQAAFPPGQTSPLPRGTYSLGFSKLEISTPFVWYWGWDSCNCAPETAKCTSGYHAGESCSEGATGAYPYGPFGGYRFSWGYSSVEGLKAYLDQAGSLKLGLDSQTKPIWLSGPIFTDSQGNVYGVGDNYSTLDCGAAGQKKVAIYSAQTGNYLKWIAELASSLKNHPNLKALTITHGLDGESRCRPDGCTLPAGQPDPCAGYEEYRQSVTNAFYKNFCNGNYDQTNGFCQGTMKPVYVQIDPWLDAGGKLGQRMPPLGMKFSGFVADTLGVAYGRFYRGWGILEAFARYRNLIPTAVEPKYGNWFLAGVPGEQTGQGTYWFNLEALWLRPTAIDINPAYGLWGQVWEDPDYYDLINNHLNVTAQSTPDVWIALRDTPQVCGAATAADFEANPCVGKSDGLSGKRGDYDFFLRRPDGILGNKTVVLTRPEVYKSVFADPLSIEPLRLYNQEIPGAIRSHKFSRHLRRTDKATGNYYMSFDVSNDYPWAGKSGQSFEATVYFLDFGSGPFYLEYKNSSGVLIKKEITRTNSSTWKKVVVTLDDAYFNDGLEGYTDFRINNGGAGAADVYLHLVKIKGLGSRPTDFRRTTNITCTLPNQSIIQTESPLLEAKLTDSAGQALGGKNIRLTLDPYWYTNRIAYGQTDVSGMARKNLDLANLTPLFAENRSGHEVQVVFTGDVNYLSSSAICVFPLNLKRDDFQKRTLTASLSKNQVNIGDEVTVGVSVPGGGEFSVEGEGFGLPACNGTADGGSGSCKFKIGGMAIPGRRTLSVIMAWKSPEAAVSVNLPLTVLGGAVEPTPPLAKTIKLRLKGVDSKPAMVANQTLSFKVKIGSQELNSVVGSVGDQGIWTLNLGNFNLGPGTNDIFIKGPKHIRKKFSGVSFDGAILGDLPPGDLPNASGVQDGVVNSLDAVYLTGCFAAPEESICLSRADLDLDGTITTRDMELMNSTIVSQQWEDEE